MLSILGFDAVFLIVSMWGAWRLRVSGGSSGWIDTIWSGAVGLAGAASALAASGAAGRKALVAALIFIWGARLALHIASRTKGAPDDPRYVELEAQWGEAARSRLLLFLLIQAAAGLVLVVAIVAAAANPAPFPSLLDGVGAALFAAALLGEAAADRQLRAFRRAHPDRQAVCDVGLWSLSRHPNYVFEWLVWCAVAVIGLGHPLGLVALAAPALMYALLAHASGVPPLEAHMLKSRGEAYRAYQRRVPAFFPRPR